MHQIKRMIPISSCSCLCIYCLLRRSLYKRFDGFFFFFYHFSISTQLKSFLINEKVLVILHSQYHGCWCPGSLCYKGICRHGILTYTHLRIFQFSAAVRLMINWDWSLSQHMSLKLSQDKQTCVIQVLTRQMPSPQIDLYIHSGVQIYVTTPGRMFQ